MLGHKLVHLFQPFDPYSDDETDSDDERTRGPPIPWNDRSGQLTHKICQRNGPEDQTDRDIVLHSEDDSDDTDTVTVVRPHQYCGDNRDRFYAPRSGLKEFWKIETMPLALLRACRQTYVEASHILWTTNTFSFDMGAAFKEFMLTRSMHQRRTIRHLRIELEWSTFDPNYNAWNKALDMGTARSLSGLRSLCVKIVHDMTEEAYHSCCDPPGLDFMLSWPEDTYFCESLRKLSIQPLVSADVMVQGSPYRFGDAQWTRTSMEEVAGRLRRMLLNPRGAEDYAGAKRKEKDANAELRERKT